MTTNAVDSGWARAGHRRLSWKQQLVWSFVSLASFHAAHLTGFGWLLIPCAYGLIELSHAPTNRRVFYPTLGLGFLFYAPQLAFFWNIFNAAAIALWLVLAFWIALFCLTLRLVRRRFGNGWTLLIAPFIWTGLEYFRSELYYLRFSWLTFGMANVNSVFHGFVGMYAFGFVVFAIAAVLQGVRAAHYDLEHSTSLDYSEKKTLPLGGPIRLMTMLLIALLLMELLLILIPRSGWWAASGPYVAGVQLEFPSNREVIAGLDRAKAKFPEAELFMLSEYTFQEPVPQAVRDWCVSNQAYLVAGGKEPLGETNFYDMAYVVGTNGDIVFKQCKSVPIQFFKDGLPAPERRVWDSPWGKMGVPTCYDLSYTRVVDDFVRQGAVALLNPTMDVIEWGEQQHLLHSRVAPIRAAEYGIPIFRVASSGISQIIAPRGQILAKASFPGEGEIIGGRLPINSNAHLPVDRWLAPLCSGIAGVVLAVSLIPSRKNLTPRPNSPS